MASWSKAKGNLTPELSAKVLRFGVIVFAVGLVLSVILVKSGLHPGLRSVLFVPFFLASNAIAMGLFGICPFRARKGLRETGEGDFPIADRNERQCLATRGLAVAVGAIGFATALTTLFTIA
jgi:hypothetical protein